MKTEEQKQRQREADQIRDRDPVRRARKAELGRLRRLNE